MSNGRCGGSVAEADDRESFLADFEAILLHGIGGEGAVAIHHLLPVDLHTALSDQPPRFGLAGGKSGPHPHPDERIGGSRQHFSFGGRRKLPLTETMVKFCPSLVRRPSPVIARHNFMSEPQLCL